MMMMIKDYCHFWYYFNKINPRSFNDWSIKMIMMKSCFESMKGDVAIYSDSRYLPSWSRASILRLHVLSVSPPVLTMSGIRTHGHPPDFFTENHLVFQDYLYIRYYKNFGAEGDKIYQCHTMGCTVQVVLQHDTGIVHYEQDYDKRSHVHSPHGKRLYRFRIKYGIELTFDGKRKIYKQKSPESQPTATETNSLDESGPKILTLSQRENIISPEESEPQTIGPKLICLRDKEILIVPQYLSTKSCIFDRHVFQFLNTTEKGYKRFSCETVGCPVRILISPLNGRADYGISSKHLHDSHEAKIRQLLKKDPQECLNSKPFEIKKEPGSDVESLAKIFREEIKKLQVTNRIPSVNTNGKRDKMRTRPKVFGWEKKTKKRNADSDKVIVLSERTTKDLSSSVHFAQSHSDVLVKHSGSKHSVIIHFSWTVFDFMINQYLFYRVLK